MDPMPCHSFALRFICTRRYRWRKKRGERAREREGRRDEPGDPARLVVIVRRAYGARRPRLFFSSSLPLRRARANMCPAPAPPSPSPRTSRRAFCQSRESVFPRPDLCKGQVLSFLADFWCRDTRTLAAHCQWLGLHEVPRLVLTLCLVLSRNSRQDQNKFFLLVQDKCQNYVYL